MISSHFAALAISTGTKWLPETVFLETKRFSPGSAFPFPLIFPLALQTPPLAEHPPKTLPLPRQEKCSDDKHLNWDDSWSASQGNIPTSLQIYMYYLLYILLTIVVQEAGKNKDASQVSLLKRFFTWEWNSKKWGPGDGIVPMKKCPRWESFPSSQLPTSSEGLKSRSGWPNPGYQPGWGG